jgi:hypothetical protein
MPSLLTFHFQRLTVLLPSMPTIVPVMPMILSANADANANLLTSGNQQRTTNNYRLATNNWQLRTRNSKLPMNLKKFPLTHFPHCAKSAILKALPPTLSVKSAAADPSAAVANHPKGTFAHSDFADSAKRSNPIRGDFSAHSAVASLVVANGRIFSHSLLSFLSLFPLPIGEIVKNWLCDNNDFAAICDISIFCFYPELGTRNYFS